MTDFDDLRLNEPSAEPGPPVQEPPTGRSLLIPALVIAAIIAIGAVVLFWPAAPEAPAKVETNTTTAAPVSPPARTPAPQAVAGENIPLPPLDQTDALVRQLVSKLSSHPRVAAWLATDGLLRNFAVVVANIADGATPVKQLRKQRPAAPFSVRETPDGTFINPESYRRYDAYADAVAGLDARATAQLYETLKPRIADAYRDLGYPNADIDAALKRAFTVLLNAPIPPEPVAVRRTSVTWKYADPALESLPQAQKQLIRMGARNERLIQDKLREIAPYLGFEGF